jgi:hypothetical protein
MQHPILISDHTLGSKRGRRPFRWDADSRDGERDSFYHGRERSEGEESEAARGSTKGGEEWCTGFGEPVG